MVVLGLIVFYENLLSVGFRSFFFFCKVFIFILFEFKKFVDRNVSLARGILLYDF